MRWWMTVAVAAVGCVGATPSDDGSQVGDSGPHCAEKSRTALAVDEVAPVGFSAQDVLDLVVGARTYSLVWADRAPTDLAFEVAPTGVYEYVEQEIVDDSTGTGPAIAIAPWCPNQLSVGATVTFSTADGAFAEALADDVLADTAGLAALTDPLKSLVGSYDPWDHVASDAGYDDLTSWLDVAFDTASGVQGVVRGQGSGVDGDVAWADNLELATFGDPAE